MKGLLMLLYYEQVAAAYEISNCREEVTYEEAHPGGSWASFNLQQTLKKMVLEWTLWDENIYILYKDQ